MNFKQYLVFFGSLFLTSCLHCATIAQKPPMGIKSSPKITPPQAPYTSQLKALKSLPANVINAWQALFQIYQQNSSKTTSQAALTPTQKTALLPLFSTNFFTLIENYTTTKNFPSLPNDPESTIHTNYATTHINKTAARLASISSIDFSTNTPTVQFKGDNRDLGIIVNIQNNSQAQFSISQNSLDGKESTQIGLLTHGLNAVNLHTAALQNPATPTAKGAGTVSSNPVKISQTKQASTTSSIIPGSEQESKTLYYFELQELDANNPTTISLKIMSGTELVTFLRTLPRKPDAVKKDTFEMNGLPTSPEYLANPKDYYLVLIQNPTSSTAQERNPGQRIQAINISKLSGPYLLTMQINPFTIEVPATATTQTQNIDIFQSSINTVLLPKNKFATMTNFSFLLLPQFVWNLPDMQSLWMLYTSSHIATLTDFKFFGVNTFSNAYEYFTNLGCLSMSNKYTFFIDTYNAIPLSNTLYDTPWLISLGLYETNLDHCSDITKIRSAQDTNAHIVANAAGFYYINFQILSKLNKTLSINQIEFDHLGFNSILSSLASQSCNFISNALKKDLKVGIFAELKQIKSYLYQLIWTNKKNEVLNSQYIHFKEKPTNFDITFVNQTTDYVGSTVPINLSNLTSNTPIQFKITYEYTSDSYKHVLLAQPTSAIDKQDEIFVLHFSKYPLTELYLDIYQTYNVKPYTRCFIIKNSILPEPLTSLLEDDWKTGVYFIPTVHNNQKISDSNPGTLTILFYKSDKTYLGQMTTTGQLNNTEETGIREPVSAYNLRSAESNSWIDIYLSTGILFKYDPINPALKTHN